MAQRPVDIGIPFKITNTATPLFVEGEETLADSIFTILSTTPGDRVYRPTFGCWLKRLIFSNLDLATALQARSEARRAIAQWEPRVTVDDIFFGVDDSGVISLFVTWRANGREQDSTTTITFGDAA